MSLGDVIRLKRWKTFLADGRSSVTYDVFPEYGKGKTVAVFVMLGVEPVTEGPNNISCDDAILRLAQGINEARAAAAARDKAVRPKKSRQKPASRLKEK